MQLLVCDGLCLNQGMISPIFGKLSKNGVPIYALIVSTIVGCLSLLSGIYAEDTVYLWLLSIAGFGGDISLGIYCSI